MTSAPGASAGPEGDPAAGRTPAADRFGEPDAATDLVVEAPGVEEVSVVPWPVVWRQRVTARVERHDRYPWLVLSAALFGLFSVGFSITVLTIAIPEIARELDSSTNTLIWAITGPILLGAVITPIAGKMADLFGARRVYLVSMLTVALFAGLSAVAWSAPSLLAFRIVGAAIGAATGPASVAIINRLFSRERRAQALGYWSLVAAGGPVLGVVIGGPVVEHVSWRWIFIAQVPLTLLTVVAAALIFPETPRNRDTRFDLVGALLLACGVGSFALALNRAPGAGGLGWSHPLVVGGFIASPLLLLAFALYERRATHQLIPTRYFPRRNFTMPMANMFMANFAYMGGFFLTPFLLENVLGYTETKTGLVSIARPAAFAVAGPIAGWWATRVGERRNGVTGGLLITASMLLFATVGPETPVLLIIVALMLSGIGMGTTAPAMAAAVANAVDAKDLGVAGGTEQMFASIGVVVGTQVMVTVQQASGSTSAASSFSAGYLVGAAAAVLAVVTAALVRPSTGRHAAPALGVEPASDALQPGPEAAVRLAEAS